MNDHSDTDDAGDGDGVWSPHIEQCFREALLLFPPCGRRKHILQEEGGGKMYGRNELIARHIRMRTGKIRTRKQVSSHIQVLARRKAKAEASSNGAALNGPESPASSLTGPIGRMSSRPESTTSNNHPNETINSQHQAYYDDWADRPIMTKKIRLVEFSAFIEFRQSQMVTFQAHQPSINQMTTNLSNLATAALAANGNMAVSQGEVPMIKADSPLVGHHSTLSGNSMSQPLATISSSAPTTPSYLQPPQTIFEGATQLVDASVSLPNNSSQQPLTGNQQNHQQMNQRNHQEADLSMILSSGASVTNTANANSNHLQQNLNQSTHQVQNHNQQNTSSGYTRHSYVKIDYRMPFGRQTNKLEKIVLSQIQDKFPEIGGPEGLYQRGPSDAFFLVKFWADLNCDHEYNVDDQNSYFGFSCHFETIEPHKDITCSTKACSYGLQVVEKVEKIYCSFNNNNGRYSYKINRSPMCEFMIQFIKKLRQLPRASQMNSVLENFTVLQEITCESTSEVLLCLAYVFEVASPDQNNGSQYHVYKLTKD